MNIPSEHEMVLRRIASMKFFSGDDELINLGEWKRWRAACQEAGKTLNPSEFKKNKPLDT